MQAGKLIHRVQIQARTIAQDTFGDGLQTWATVATVWAQVEGAGGSETWQADSQRPDATHTVTIRYRDWVTPRHRLLYFGRALNIESVTDPDGELLELKLSCKEEV